MTLRAIETRIAKLESAASRAEPMLNGKPMSQCSDEELRAELARVEEHLRALGRVLVSDLTDDELQQLAALVPAVRHDTPLAELSEDELRAEAARHVLEERSQLAEAERLARINRSNTEH